MQWHGVAKARSVPILKKISNQTLEGLSGAAARKLS